MVSGEIHIDNPDADIFLGVEAKVKIQGAVAEDAIAVPIEAVNVGREGSFVYIVENGVLAVRNVETGIASTELLEIKSGLDGSEQIVLNNSAGLPEGTPVTPVEG